MRGGAGMGGDYLFGEVPVDWDSGCLIGGKSGRYSVRMRLGDYLAEPSVGSDDILDDWRWRIGPQLKLWRITLAGDAFLIDSSNGSIHFLDTVAGKVERVADDKAGFESAIKTFENFDRWCMPTVVDGQGGLGMRPA